MRFYSQVLSLVLVLSAAGTAADLAVLRNGYTIRHETRALVGDITRLYISADRSSFVDVPTAEVERYEKDDSAPQSASQVSAPSPGVSTASRGAGKALQPLAKASPEEIADAIGSASSRYRLDPDFVASVVSAESNFNSRAVSKKGAQGLMQLMPGTASQLGVDNAFDAAKNTEGGTKYLRMLLERFNFDVAKALAAYNAGPMRVDQHNGVPPFRETRQYVARIINDYNRKKIAQGYAAKPPSGAKSGKTASHKSQQAAQKQQIAQKKAQTPPKAQLPSQSGTVYQAETFHQQ